MRPMATFFGILSDYEDPPYDSNTALFANFIAAVGFVNLLSLKAGDAEKPGARIAREDLNFMSSVGMALTYSLAMVKGVFTGTFAQFWTAFVIVLALGHYRIVSSGFGSTRKAMKDNLFKGATNNIDAISSGMFIFYGVMIFLALGLNLEFLHGFCASNMSFFGMLTPEPPAFVHHQAARYGGGCFLGMAALSVPAFSGAAEDSDYAAVRRTAHIAAHVAGIISMAALPVNGSAFTFWTAMSAVLAVLLSTKNTTLKTKAD